MSESGLRATALAVAAVLFGCGGIGDDTSQDARVHVEMRRITYELRPTDPSDPFGYEGADAQSIVSPGGDFRVWWAGDGTHAVPAADADQSGVPDYVEMVAQTADDVAHKLTDDGWKLALGDDPGGAGTPLGGDGLFDIYLVDFSAGDGHYSKDWCRQNEHGVSQCAGHFRLENDFAGLNYPSAQYAAKLVLSHEYFHAVQDAYMGDFPGWWSEGSATWYEEVFDPTQDDFERLTSLYFDEHTRTLDDRSRGPSDAFSYGASIFLYFLELHIGQEGVRAIFERVAAGESLMEALDAELTAGFVPTSEAFDVFATYNLFTGDLATSEHGYPDAERFWGVSVESQQVDQAFNWNLDADPLAARYTKLTFDEPITLQAGAVEGFDTQPSFIAVNRGEYAQSGVVYVVGADEPTRFAPEMSPIYVVVSNGHTDARRAGALKVRLAGPDESDGDEPVVISNGDEAQAQGCASAGGSTPLGALWLLGVCGLALAALRRRKVHD